MFTLTSKPHPTSKNFYMFTHAPNTRYRSTITSIDQMDSSPSKISVPISPKDRIQIQTGPALGQFSTVGQTELYED
jgi:hypothetical protein